MYYSAGEDGKEEISPEAMSRGQLSWLSTLKKPSTWHSPSIQEGRNIEIENKIAEQGLIERSKKK